MKVGPNNDPEQDMRREENDPLWRLLAQSPRPEPDGWFAARTLVRCRGELQASSQAWFPHLAQIWRWALGGGLAVSLALVLMASQLQTEKVPQQPKVQEAFEIMASIDTDSDSSSTTSWQDSSY